MDHPFTNRLRKNFRHFKKMAAREGLTAFRVYDRDIPEYPFVVDWYDGRVHLGEFPRRGDRREGTLDREGAIASVSEVLGVAREHIHVKTHAPKTWGKEQYERVGQGSETFVVEEQGLKFWVNLGDYLDTGLFLDHRQTRARVREEARGKRFLNLFAYTGSFTVYAAAGGARSTTTVDLSNTYLEWAERNLALNGLLGPAHALVRANVVEWLHEEAQSNRRYDLVVLDPPSFSTSKRMSGTFDVQRDHPKLLADAVAVLAPGGVLYFSTNFKGFALQPLKAKGVSLEEITPRSLPDDIQQKDIHRCWRIRLLEPER